MKVLSSAIVLAASLACGGSMQAQKYVQPTFNNCIRQYYDPQAYNWLAFQNTCGRALSVTFVSRNSGGSVWGTMDSLGPGQHDNTGHSRQEVEDAGGAEIYVCPKGYQPVDSADRPVGTRYLTEFSCKNMSY
jgi:hypothetical protein